MKEGIMKKNTLWILLILFVSSSSLFAEEMLIKLKDGVVVRGEVVSMRDGIYTIRSKMLGEIAVRGSDVLSMSKIEDESGVFPADRQRIERQIMSNPQFMQSVQNIAQDESVLEMLSDPAIKSAIMRQDVEYLQQNKKFKQFMGNPAVQGLVEDISRQAQDSSKQ